MKYLGIILLFLLIACGGFVFWKYFYVYSEGYREGKLNKFSNKGTIFKTYEGELWMQDLVFGNRGSNSDIIFYFSAEDPFVVKKLEGAIGKKVKLHYTQYNGALPWRGDNYEGKNKESGQYVIDEVTVLGGMENSYQQIQNQMNQGQTAPNNTQPQQGQVQQNTQQQPAQQTIQNSTQQNTNAVNQ